MAVLSNTGIRAGASGVSDAYQIEKSLRFNGDDDAHLNRTFASGGSVSTWTLSFWIKGADLAQACYVFTGGTGTNSYITMDVGQFRFYSNNHDLKSSARYRDPSAWYHFVCVADTTNGTTADRQRVYVNGERITDWATESNVSGSGWALGDFNSAATHYFNRLTTGSQEDFMLADVHFVDAAAKEPTDFGEANADTGQWLPKKYAGSYGTTGFHLKFTGSDIGEDSAGSNDWTADNLTAAGTNFDVPCVRFDWVASDNALSIADHADLSFGGDDFTVECWVRPETPSGDTYHSIAGSKQTNNASSSWWFNMYSKTDGTSNVMFYFYHGANANYANSGYILPHDKWSHVVGTRDGDDLRIYVDGVQQSSIDISSYVDMNDPSSPVTIGSDGDGNNDLKGSISNLRVVKGTCLYPDGTTFTVPSRPLENVTNTKLLCCQSSTQASAATVAHTVSGSINDGTGWSDLVEGTLNSEYSSSDRSVIFNGTAWGSSLSNTIRPNAGNLLEIDFGTRFNSATSVKITGQASLDGTTYTGTNENLEINGTAISASAWDDNGGSGAGAAGSATFSLSSGLQKIGWGYDYGSASSGYLYLAAIEVDGVELKNPLIPSGNINVFEGATTKSDDDSDSDVSIDTPNTFDNEGNGTGNYCTWNAVFGQPTYSNTLSQGNLTVTGTGDRHGTMRFGPGKWYWEVTYDGGTLGQQYIGIVDIRNTQDRVWPTAEIAATRDSGYGFYGDSSTGSSVASWSAGDVLNFAVDVDNQKFFIGVNGTWTNSGNPASGTGASFTGRDFTNYTPLFSDNEVTAVYTANFGARGYKYTPPSGFKSLNTYTLADPVVTDPSKHFNAVLYAGDPGVSNAITGVGFEPGFVWARNRDGAMAHNLFDQVRGDTKVIYADYTAAEDPITTFEFTSDGFTTDATDNGWNGDYNYTSWHWKAASSDTTKSAGDLNSLFYNTSGWVAATTATNIYSGASLSSILNGQDGGSFHANIPNPLVLEWSSGTISGNVRLKLRTYGTAAHTYKVAGSATEISITVPTIDTFEWYDLGNIDLVEYKGTCPSSGNAAAIEAIELDGKILVDSGETPTNVPSITSTYRADPDAGFSIVKWTNGTLATTNSIAYGLNASADFVIIKDRDSADGWYTYHSHLGKGKYQQLQSNAVPSADAALWGAKDPDSNCFHIGNTFNGTGDYIAYCWSEVAGYSRFSYYTGNGLDGDGPFVWCGFKPAWILIKRTDTAAHWVLYDDKINPYNEASNSFPVSNSGSETWITSDEIDILSNGFKCRSNDSIINGSTSAKYVFAAFASKPFKYSNAR